MATLKANGPNFDTVTGYDFTLDKALTPRKAMRQKCLECCAGSKHEVKNCAITGCFLWPYRHGRGIDTGSGVVFRETNISELETKRRREKMKAVRAKKEAA